MKRYELPISPDYVSHWGLPEAGRELIANLYDSMQKIYCGMRNGNYVLENGIDERVPRSSMVLGCSTKEVMDDDTIGQFGEGLKLAIVVILRDANIDKITIKNWDLLWTFTFEDSETWGVKTLVMTEEPLSGNEGKFSVEFKCHGEGMQKLLEQYLINQTLALEWSADVPKFETEYGKIYFTQESDGSVFVGGIYIDNPGSTRYTIDLDPSQVSLNRERSYVDEETLFERYKEIVEAMMAEKDESLNGYLFEILRSGSFASRLVKELADEEFISEWAAELFEKAKNKIICSSENEEDVAASLGADAIVFSSIERSVYDSVANGAAKSTTFREEFKPNGAHAEVVKFIDILTTKLRESESTKDLIEDEELQKATKRIKTMSSKWWSYL